MIKKLIQFATMLTFSSALWAQSSQLPVAQVEDKKEAQKVVVKGKTDLEESREFAAGKLIIGRNRIAESGLQTTSELLKREPAITVGKDGGISLLGLSGYTRVLLDGQTPIGKSPLDMNLSEVERIEIIKSNTAETGPFGIAGTINVISKKIDRKKSQQANLDLKDTAGIYGVNGDWSINDANLTDPLKWRLYLGASRSKTETPTDFVQREYRGVQNPISQFQARLKEGTIFEYVSLSSSAEYRVNEENTFSVKPGLSDITMRTENKEMRSFADGRHSEIASKAANNLRNLNLPFSYSVELADTEHIDFYLKYTRQQTTTIAMSSNLRTGSGEDSQRSSTEGSADIYRLGLNYDTSLNGGHEVKAGGHWSRSVENTSYSDLLNGRPDTNLAMYGTSKRLMSEERRLFVQDEWRINKITAFNSGVTVQENLTDIQEGAWGSKGQYRVWSPSLHFSRKLPSDTKRQFRFSLARSFQAPNSNDFSLKPAVNVFAPCSLGLVCERNSLDTADTVGNPKLRPERAISLNSSYEHGLSENSQLSLEFYARQIEQKFGRSISLENVPWSNVMRYVNRPINLGTADLVGASVDWRVALRDIRKDAPKIDFRGSLGRAHSTVSNLPTPYNHLDGQMRWRGKIGMTYDVESLPLKLNFDANWLPSDWIQNNLVQKTYESKSAFYSASASWSPNKAMKWTLNLNNVFAATRYGAREYKSNQTVIQRQSERPSYTQIGLRLEMKL